MVFGLLAGACASGGGILVPSSQLAGPAFTETVIQSGLIVPWEVAVAGDGRMFVTERPGTISVFESTAAMAKRTASAQVSGVRAMGEAGLLGLALDPDFSRNQLFYVCASRLDQGDYGNCFDCGEEIAEKRLRALPFAVRCKDCEEARENAQQRERQVAARRGASSLFLDM